VTLPPLLARFWEAMSRAGRSCTQTSWGFVVADPRYPRVWDANHAAVLTPDEHTAIGEIRAELHPALRWAGAPTEHVELWALPPDAPLRAELDLISSPLPADVDMVFEGGVASLDDPPLQDIEVRDAAEFTSNFLDWYRSMRTEFGQKLPDEVLDQMLARDLDVFFPAGMRLFVAWHDGQPVGYTSLLSLAGVGYLDGVVTMPAFRGRGVATATVTAAVRASVAAGDEAVHLLAEEHGRARALYERLGFRVRARVESLTRPLDADDA